MAKVRSPQYPLIGLEEAIGKAQLVWEKDYTSELPREVIAEHMGYGSLNGKSLGIIAAVAKYGLLDGRGDKTHITDLAVRILAHESGDPQRAEAVAEAAKAPKLFQEIWEKFGGRSPSDQALKSYLFTRGFTHNGVEVVIRSFRDTEAFVSLEVEEYADDQDSTNQEAEQMHSLAPAPEQPATPVTPKGVPTISMSDSGLEISGGVVSTMEQFDKLMKRLSAGRVLLEDDDDGSEGAGQ